MPSLLDSAAHNLIRGVTFRSQLTPDYAYNPWAPSEPAPPNPLLALAKPAVVLDTAAGPIEIAPYGTPTEDYSGIAALSALALVVGAVVLVGWAARKIR